MGLRSKLGGVKKMTGFGMNLLTNPVGTVGGYVVDSVTGRLIETDSAGEPVSEDVAIQMKLDRMIQLLTFIAKEMNAREFEKVFREEVDSGDSKEKAELVIPEVTL